MSVCRASLLLKGNSAGSDFLAAFPEHRRFFLLEFGDRGLPLNLNLNPPYLEQFGDLTS